MLIQPAVLTAIALLAAGGCFSIYTQKLTAAAAITGVVCGTIIYLGAGYMGLAFAGCLFFMRNTVNCLGKKVERTT
ncbi:hypothetical protein [Pedobacter sp. NJ-S-72]